MKHLYPIDRAKIIDEKYYVFDVETQGLSARPESFLFGCIYGKDYRKVFFSHEEFEEILNDKRFSKCYIFAHNAEFDLSVMYGNILQNLDAKAIFNNRFICARHKKFLFADSFNLFGFSVAEIGKQLGIQKMDIDSNLQTGTVRKIEHFHVEYCFRDCEIVWVALNKLFRITGTVKITMAGVALNYFRNTFLRQRLSSDDKYIYEFFSSYYGGRVEVFKLGKVHAYKYDVNSMYPYAMKNAIFPDPFRLKKDDNLSVERLNYYLKVFEGMAKCKVRHKKGKFGYLPYKDPKSNKLIFPVGTFTGTWNFNELRYAIEKGKVEILSVEFAIYSNRYKSPFVEFVDCVYDLRSKSNGIDKTVYKLILNSLYGKFAQRIKYDEIYYKEVPYDEIKKLQEKGVDYELQMFSAERDDCFLKIKKNKNLHHTIPLFSSYITSYSRIVLLKYMEENEKGLVYVDTDSICTSIKKEYDSKELGGLKIEPALIQEIYGNKSYKEITGDVEKLKLKGIPTKAEKVGKNKYKFLKMNKTKESLRRKIKTGEFNIVEKVLEFEYDKRIRKSNGYTEAIQIHDA